MLFFYALISPIPAPVLRPVSGDNDTQWAVRLCAVGAIRDPRGFEPRAGPGAAIHVDAFSATEITHAPDDLYQKSYSISSVVQLDAWRALSSRRIRLAMSSACFCSPATSTALRTRISVRVALRAVWLAS